MRRVAYRVGCLTLILVWLISFASYASAQSQVTHVVQPGENLFRIALYYGTTVDAIQNANSLGSAFIHVGQRLTIPNAATTEPPEEPLTPENAVTPEPSDGPDQPASEVPPEEPAGIDARSYLVQAGDTLTSIAARLGVSLWALMEENGLSSWSTIYVGQELVIPGATEEEPAAEEPAADQPGAEEPATPEPAADQSGSDDDEAGATETETAEGEATPQTYTVQRGDTLFSIASRFGTSVAAVSRLNGIANPSQIYVGQVLRLTGEAPAPRSTGGGKLILVDISDQHLYAYQGDELIYSFVASTGAAPYYTRAGEFRVQSKIPNAYGSTWDIWMPNWLGIYYAGSTENGIHALPVMPNGTVLWAGYLGSPVSYGCIVLGTQESKLLYDWAEIGTAVSIQY